MVREADSIIHQSAQRAKRRYRKSLGISEGGFDPQELLIQTTACLRDFMVFQATGGVASRDDGGFFEPLNQRMPLDRTIYILKLFLNVRGDIKLTGCERVQLMKLAF